MEDPENPDYEALLKAAENGDILEIARLNATGIEIDFVARHDLCFSGQVTALSEASKNGHLQCIQKLVEIGAGEKDEEHKMVRYKFAMEMAVIKGHFDCFRFLVVNRLFKPISGGQKYVNASERGDFDQIQNLLDEDVDKDILNGWKGNNLMSLLLFYGCPPSCLHTLIDHNVGIVNGFDYNGFTPLMSAVLAGNIECVHFLLEKGADVNASDVNDTACFLPDGTVRLEAAQGVSTTALMYAACLTSSECLRKMLPFLSADDINHVNSKNWSPVTFAVYFGNTESYCILVENSVWANTAERVIHKLNSWDMHVLSGSVDTGLELTIKPSLRYDYHQTIKDFYVCVSNLSSLYGVINSSIEKIDSGLMMQAVGKDVDCLRFLLDNNCDIEAKDMYEETALMKCCLDGTSETFDFLLERGADIHARNMNNHTPIMVAARSYMMMREGDFGHDGKIIERQEKKIKHSLYCLDKLVSHGASLHVQSNTGETPLMVACQYGNDAFVEALIKLGVDVDARKNDGKTALFFVKTVKCFQMLIDHGASIHVKDNEETTALMHLCCYGRHEIVDLLIDKGVDVNAQDQNGKTPVLYAAKKNQYECLQLLVDAGADLDHVDKEGETVLSLVFSGSGGSLEVLMKSGKIFSNGVIKPHHRDAIMKHWYIELDLRDVFKAINCGMFLWEFCHKVNYLDQVIFPVVYKSIGPGTFKHKDFDFETSLLPLAFLQCDVPSIKFLLANRYFLPEDYAILSSNTDFREQIQHDEVSETLEQLTLHPLSMQTWCFLTISKAVSQAGPLTKWSDRVDALPVPDCMKKAFRFESSISKLCYQLWNEISIQEVFDSLNFREEMASQWSERQCEDNGDGCDVCYCEDFEPNYGPSYYF